MQARYRSHLQRHCHKLTNLSHKLSKLSVNEYCSHESQEFPHKYNEKKRFYVHHKAWDKLLMGPYPSVCVPKPEEEHQWGSSDLIGCRCGPLVPRE